MIPCNPINRKFALIIFILSLLSLQKISAQDGKALFSANCASCHSPTKDMTGPKLGDVLERDPYNGDITKIVNWVHNVDKLLASDPYYKGLMAKYGARMTAFPNLSDKDIAAIIDFTKKAAQPVTVDNGPKPLKLATKTGSSSGSFLLSWELLP